MTDMGLTTHGFEDEWPDGRQLALIDLLDRLLSGGAVLTGDVVLSVADVDLVHISLRAVIRSITGLRAASAGPVKNEETTWRSPRWVSVPLLASVGGRKK